MRGITLCIGFWVAGTCLAADKGPPAGQVTGKQLKIEAVAHLDKGSITAAVGQEMESGIVVVEVKLSPVSGEKVAISRDDFLLRSDKDGQRATPYAPTQIAGTSVLTISNRYEGGRIAAEDRGPVWGGVGGGMPQRLPGQSPGIGNTGSTAEAVASVRDETTKGKEPPLLRALKEKVLAEREISEPLSGQLYFLMEGKHKVKDLELIYQPTGAKLSIRFKQ